MSIVEQLTEELRKNPEFAKKLAKLLLDYIEPEISVPLQISRLADQMGRLAEEQMKIWQEIKAIKEEQIKLREEQTRIWQEIERLREEQTKIWQEIEALREEQMKIWQEIKAIKEEQIKLREEQTRIWQEIERLREETVKLRQDFNEMLSVIKEMQRDYRRLDRKVDRIYEGLSASIMYAFGELSKFAGLTFEEFVRKILTASMRKLGEIPKDAELRSETIDGEQVDLFLEDPLIVGEVTAHAESEEELAKLLRKAEKARSLYRREPRKILVVQTSPKNVAKRLREMAKEKGVELVIGREY